MYSDVAVGPALASLRRLRGLKQDTVEKRLGLAGGSASRIEAAASNPYTKNLLRYLDAIGATLNDLEAELKRSLSPLDEEIKRDDQRLEDEPGTRERYRRLFEQHGYQPDDDALKTVVEKLERFDALDARIRSLEEKAEKENGTE